MEDRHRAILSLIEGLRADRSDASMGDEAFLQAHQDLMPELGQELQKLRRIEAARDAAAINDSPPDSAAANLLIAQALVAEMEGLPINVPGYTVLREIGRGGQAAVYQAIQLSTGQAIALKMMREGPFADERSLARFKREVQILAALNHPNIVTIIDTGKTEDGSRYIAMKYITGFGLAEYMRRLHKNDPADPSKLLLLFYKICDAVDAAHQRGIVHRDLKPGNIRVDERGEPHVLDFGLARTTLDFAHAGGDHPVSITGEFLGSLPWSSPEQAEGDPGKIDSRTDVYSLGVILYQMLTGGRFPYEVVGNIRDILNNILTSVPMPPSKVIAADLAKQSHGNRRVATGHAPGVNETIEKIVLKALSKQPAARYPTAGEMGKDIASYLAGQRTMAREADARPDVPRHRGGLRSLRRMRIALSLQRGLRFLVGWAYSPTDRVAPASEDGGRVRPPYKRASRTVVLCTLAACLLALGSLALWRHFHPPQLNYTTIAGLELSPADPLPVPPSDQQWQLAWNDEFDGDLLDSSKWSPNSGFSETPGAVSLDGNGHLVLSTSPSGAGSVMGGITSAGKFEHGFGYYVCRVLFQEEPGMTTTFRLEGTGSQIAVFEKPAPGSQIDHVVMLSDPAHGGRYDRYNRQTASLPGPAQSWHTLAVWWTAKEYIFFIDGQESWQTPSGDDSPIARSLTLGGLINAAADHPDKPLSDSFLVDYVRIYDLVKKP